MPLLSGDGSQTANVKVEYFSVMDFGNLHQILWNFSPIRFRTTPSKSFRCPNSGFLVPPHVSVHFFRNSCKVRAWSFVRSRHEYMISIGQSRIYWAARASSSNFCNGIPLHFLTTRKTNKQTNSELIEGQLHSREVRQPRWFLEEDGRKYYSKGRFLKR